MLFPSYARLACLSIFHNWHKSKMAAIFTKKLLIVSYLGAPSFLFDIKTIVKFSEYY